MKKQNKIVICLLAMAVLSSAIFCCQTLSFASSQKAPSCHHKASGDNQAKHECKCKSAADVTIRKADFDTSLAQFIYAKLMFASSETGFSDISIADCIKKGARHVFAKPFNQKELIHSVRSALNIPD